jgi:hypothetical protein
MTTMLDPVRAAVDAVAAIDPGAISRTDLAAVVVGLRRWCDALEGEYARLLHQADLDRVWADNGAASCAAWISRATGTSPGKAKGAVALGAALEKSAPLAEAVRAGKLGTDSAAQLAVAVDDPGFADAAPALIADVSAATPREVTGVVDRWRQVTGAAAARERRRVARERRCLTFTPLGDGLERVEGILESTVAREVRLALTHLVEAQIHDGSGRTHPQRVADGLADLAGAYNRGTVTGGRNQPRALVMFTLADLDAANGTGTAATGEPITTDEIQRLCCDAHLHPVLAGQDAAILQFGRGRRTVSNEQYWALVARDRGCRFPGCHRPPHWTEAHHLREFTAHGGNTNLDELALHCTTHHHPLHEGAWTVTGPAHHLTYTSPTGDALESILDPPSQPRLALPEPNPPPGRRRAS